MQMSDSPPVPASYKLIYAWVAAWLAGPGWSGWSSAWLRLLSLTAPLAPSRCPAAHLDTGRLSSTLQNIPLRKKRVSMSEGCVECAQHIAKLVKWKEWYPIYLKSTTRKKTPQSLNHVEKSSCFFISCIVSINVTINKIIKGLKTVTRLVNPSLKMMKNRTLG